MIALISTVSIPTTIKILPSNTTTVPNPQLSPLPLHFRHCCFSNTRRPSNTAASSSLKNGTYPCSQNPKGSSFEGQQPSGLSMVPSAAAVAAAIRGAATSPVEIVQKIEYKDGKNGIVLPSTDFQRLCVQQLDLFRNIVDSHAILSVYVRPAGSYVMDQLELRRVTFYPVGGTSEMEDIVILIGTFGMSTGLRAAEAALSSQQAQIIPECKAVVFPMVKHPFIVGFLVAELPTMKLESHTEDADKDEKGLPSYLDKKVWEIQAFKKDLVKTYHQFTVEQESRAIKISLSLAMAYVMDQKAMLLQQSSWQNNVRMSTLVEQIRGPLSSIRTLSKMLSSHTKRSEISYDIIEDILVQEDRLRDTLQQLQDAVYLTKANIIRYNEEILKKMQNSTYDHPWPAQLRDSFTKEIPNPVGPVLLRGDYGTNDLEMPMPPLTLAAPRQYDIRPCNVTDILVDLVEAAQLLAHKQDRSLQLNQFSKELQVAIEESALRQALSNLIEGALLRTNFGGKVEIVSSGAPAGGALVIIDDDGPDMHYMTQMHSLTPYGSDLFSEGMLEDNMTWNFVAGLTVAREILESYGCVVRILSPRLPDAALGAGGTHIELWLPPVPPDPNFES